MAGLKLKILGSKELQSRIRRISKDLIPALQRGMYKGIIEIQNEIAKNLSGKILNVRTDRLRPSWQHIPFECKRGKNVLTRIGSNVVYARIHEFGGMAGRGRSVRIPARPYAQPALDKKRRRVLSLISKEIEKLIKGV